MLLRDTVFAVASALPASAAIVRVSGPGCIALFESLAGPGWSRVSARGLLPLAVGDTPCILWAYSAPGSYTGENALEIILPGNPWLIRQCEDWLEAAGLKRAEHGEFTRRALRNGRITTAQAQGTLALINATADAQRRKAMAELTGEAAKELRAIADGVRHLAARYEMLFDFSEEEHAAAEEATLRADLAALAGKLAQFCGAQPSRTPRPQPVVALFGPPNAGKSSLFNALIGRPRALVSPVPGTTRDPVEAVAVIEGRDALLCDLSGVGKADADAGRFAETAHARALGADFLLVLSAPGQHNEAAREFDALLQNDADLPGRSLWVNTMTDVAHGTPPSRPLPCVAVSAISGGGLKELKAAIATRLLRMSVGSTPSLLRRRAADAANALAAASTDIAAPPEATVREVRHALTLLDEALLAHAPGDVLDLIFSRFCIGK